MAGMMVSGWWTPTGGGDMGTRRTLVDHLSEYHPRIPINSRDTTATLARKHSTDHHHHAIATHSHEHPSDGPNLGPQNRPRGWRTGGDVIPRPG